MFTGLVEDCVSVTAVESENNLLKIQLERPSAFTDVQLGDSIAVDGVCLTVDHLDLKSLGFTLGPETLQITGWTPKTLWDRRLNIERSCRLGDRLHGHWVNGHVDVQGFVDSIEDGPGYRILHLRVPEAIKDYVWPKGSLAINGVSLTINAVAGERVGFCLIPETLKRTNLSDLCVGDAVLLEVDGFARACVHLIADRMQNQREGSFV